MVLNCGIGEASWESMESKEIQPVNPKRNQSWIFIGWTDAEVEAPILWPPDVKNWLTGKNLDAGKDWRQEEKGTTEDKMVGWHPRLKGHEFEQALGVGDIQWSLVCCTPWRCKESDTTEWLNWTQLTFKYTAQWRLPRWLSGRESTCQCRRRDFYPWVWKIPWKTKWQLTPVFSPD